MLCKQSVHGLSTTTVYCSFALASLNISRIFQDTHPAATLFFFNEKLQKKRFRSTLLSEFSTNLPANSSLNEKLNLKCGKPLLNGVFWEGTGEETWTFFFHAHVEMFPCGRQPHLVVRTNIRVMTRT